MSNTCVCVCFIFGGSQFSTPQKTNMTMETPQFEDVFPIDNGDVPM